MKQVLLVLVMLTMATAANAQTAAVISQLYPPGPNQPDSYKVEVYSKANEYGVRSKIINYNLGPYPIQHDSVGNAFISVDLASINPLPAGDYVIYLRAMLDGKLTAQSNRIEIRWPAAGCDTPQARYIYSE